MFSESSNHDPIHLVRPLSCGIDISRACIVTVSGSYDGLAWRVGTCTGSRTTTGLPNSTQYVQYNNNNDQYIRISTAGKE